MIYTLTFAIISIGFHNSLIIPALAFVLCYLKKNTKHYMYFWGICIILSFFVGDFMQLLYQNLGFIETGRDSSYFLDHDDMSGYALNGGFRWDFLLYSSIPIFIGYYFVKVLKFQDNYFIKNKSLNWYTRNYIGFKDINELKKFKYYFDEDDPTNNPLYKMDKLLFPNAESIVISSIFIILLASNLYGQIYYYKNNELDEQKSFYLDSFRRISTLVLFIIYLSIYLFKYLYYYHKIEEIEMEKYYAIVLEKYNKRRKQIYLLIGVILLGLNLIIEIIHYIIEYKQNQEPVTQGANNPSNKTIICELEYNELGKKRKIKFKFYLKRKFSEEKERFEKKFFRNYDIIECKINNEVIDEDKTISALKLESDSIIEVICEPIEKEVKVGNDISNE